MGGKKNSQVGRKERKTLFARPSHDHRRSTSTMGNKTSRSIHRLEPLRPLPTDEDLARDGGAWFTRPSDGRRLEYFVLGSSAGHRFYVVNVVCTSATALLYQKWRPQETVRALDDHGACLINVTAAGVGPSEPYGSWLGELDADAYLARTTADIIALIKHLGARRVVTMGVSGGWEPSAHLAVAIAGDVEPDLTLCGHISVSGIPWITKSTKLGNPEEDFWTMSMGTGLSRKVAIGLLESRMLPYMTAASFPMKPSALRPPKKVFSQIIETHEDMWPIMCNDINRANIYSPFCAAFLGRLTCGSRKHVLTSHSNLAVLASVPFHHHIAENDELMPSKAAEAWIREQVGAEAARYMCYEAARTHMQVPFEFALREMLQAVDE